MGVDRIIAVEPADFDRQKMLQAATHFAAETVDRIRCFDNLAAALSEFGYIVGTTSRLGGARQPEFHPHSLAEALIDLSQHNEIALLFGPEDFGLTNDELKYCHSVATIPTSDAFKSVNLSHAVMIICYEIFIAGDNEHRLFTPKLATSGELEGMYDQLKEVLTNIGFINPENPEIRMMNVRRFLSRFRLYAKEVQIIRGICRQIEWYGRNKKS
jgi:tRNA/rRNA methyltransferase